MAIATEAVPRAGWLAEPPLAQAHPARWWHRLDDGRLQCDLCPRECRLHEGQRGLCVVRQRQGDALAHVLDTLQRIRHESACWLEITTLLIPGLNDSTAELRALTHWVATELGIDLPFHFTAYHPDYKLDRVPRTPTATLQRARRIGQDAGLQHVYIGNVRDLEGTSTFCSGCRAPLIRRDGYRIVRNELDAGGACPFCATAMVGHFSSRPAHRPSRLSPT